MPAGTYHVIYDAIIIGAVDVTFDLVHRRAGTDTMLATWSQHCEPSGGGDFEAQAFEIDQTAPAIEVQSGDELIYRYSGDNSTAGMAFIPVGFPESEGGRITTITLPR